MPESSSSTDPRYLVGRLGRPHGLQGYIGLYADDADVVYFEPGRTIFVDDAPHTVGDVRRADRGFHLKLEGIDSREAAESIRGNDVFATERRELQEEEYWPDDLVGLEVRDASGVDIGTVAGLVVGGAQDRLVVAGPDGRYDVPFVHELVPVVDVAAGYVVVATIPGLSEPSA